MSKTIDKHRLYQHEYPLLLKQLERLETLARTRDPNVAYITLFGSVARLEPHGNSDADVLILVHDQAQYYAAEPTPGAALLWMAYQGENPYQHESQLSNWPVTAVVSDLTASDMDTDFLANVARDGVELYRQKGYSPPAVLSHLMSWRQWQERITQSLALANTAQ